jgi:uncharacterized protein (TIGR03435 family)
MSVTRGALALSIAIVTASTAVLAQSSTPAPTAPLTFEVASVKPSAPADGSPISQIPRLVPSGGRLTIVNMPLRLLIMQSRGLQDFQIAGGPPWQMTKRFDITAKAPDGFSGDNKQLIAMLESLLAERFGLKTHMEKREMPTYSLVIARSDGKLGPDMTPSKDDCGDPSAPQKRTEELLRGGAAAAIAALQSPEGIPCMILPMADAQRGMGMRGRGQPMQAITALLTQLTGRMVRDNTGLTGLYDWKIKFDPEIMLRAASQLGLPVQGVTLPPSDSPSILTALREQLGLKLESDRGQVDVLVIDEAKEPTEN